MKEDTNREARDTFAPTGGGKNVKENFHRTRFCPAIADYCSTVDVLTQRYKQKKKETYLRQRQNRENDYINIYIYIKYITYIHYHSCISTLTLAGIGLKRFKQFLWNDYLFITIGNDTKR